MIKITRFDHLTIAVEDLDKAMGTFSRLFGLGATDRRQVGHMGMENAFISLGDVAIEMVSPLDEDVGPDDVRKTLDRRGEGMMNLCLTVEDIEAAAAHLEEEGARVIRGRDADDDPILFVHPKDTHGVLVELRTGKRHIRK
jgi:methylmalonyl-CoA/ethylmalonyl-CoA epimerase